MPRKSAGPFVFTIAFIAAIGGLLFGFDLGLISGALVFLREAFQLNPTTKGFVASAAALGCIVGPLFGMWFADHWGRRKTLLLASVLLIISALGSALALGPFDFVCWRWVGGVGIGLASIVSPMYIAELSPPRWRGALINVYQLSIVIGIIGSTLVAYALSFGGHWRWMFASEAVPILLWLVGFLVLPRSPRWLAARGHHQESIEVLTKISGVERAKVEFDEILESLSEETGSFKELIQPGIRLALLIGAGILVFSQINGISAIHVYAPTIFVESGLGSPSNAILNLLYLDVFMLISAVAAFYTIVRFKRRHLLLAGFGAIMVAQLLMGCSFRYHLSASFMLLAMILVYGSHNLTIGPLGWIINSEIFPNRIRNRAMSITGICFWSSNYSSQLAFPVVSDFCATRLGDESAVFVMFAVVNLIAMLLVWRFVPETKDLTLEQIGAMWIRKSSARVDR